MIENNSNILQILYKHYLDHPHICIDSRSVIKDSLFFGLPGKTYHGNYFATQALERGAAYAVIDDVAYYQPGGHYKLVTNTLQALQALAQRHRQELTIPVVGITGSNGKTTTKELLAAMLRKKYRCYATMGNFNNGLGVPLSLLAIGPDIEVAVIEMGASGLGEIAALCEIAQPTHGLITNIGPAHIAGFNSMAGVKQGKSELYAYLKRTGGVLFINAADPTLVDLSKPYDNLIYYLSESSFYQAKLLKADPFLVYQNESGKVINTHLLGSHHLSNAAAAACIAKYMGVEPTTIDAAIGDYIPSNNRSQVVHKGTNLVILDAYNANPPSMKAALDSFANLPATYKVAILGNMDELGTDSLSFHQQVVALTAQQGYQEVLLHGSDMAQATAYNPDALYFRHKEALASYLQARIFSHTAFLIKGSRSYGLESLLACIKIV
jgi:UDP-N-acetylmuramoyl-tripeptide--D-alanyl-D-alanine ligase